MLTSLFKGTTKLCDLLSHTWSVSEKQSKNNHGDFFLKELGLSKSISVHQKLERLAGMMLQEEMVIFQEWNSKDTLGHSYFHLLKFMGQCTKPLKLCSFIFIIIWIIKIVMKNEQFVQVHPMISQSSLIKALDLLVEIRMTCPSNLRTANSFPEHTAL